MNKIVRTLTIGSLMLGASFANAAAIISDGNVSLGVNDLGQLNVRGGSADIAGETRVGLRYIPPAGGGTEYESTSHGCECEGWGVGIADTGVSGYANNSSGTAGLGSVSFGSTATTATSVTSMDRLIITHDFALAAETDNLYRVTVSIENTGADVADLRYRRTMDWDTSPTPFREFVNIGGTAGATAVLDANDNGFCSSNPFSACSPLVAGATGDFEDSGPADHGANFDFGFGALASGETLEFDIFYGGADNEADAMASLAAVGAEVFSLGRSHEDADHDGFGDSSGRVTPTFIFGFSGVGGTPVATPEPGSLALLGLGLVGLLSSRRRKS